MTSPLTRHAHLLLRAHALMQTAHLYLEAGDLRTCAARLASATEIVRQAAEEGDRIALVAATPLKAAS